MDRVQNDIFVAEILVQYANSFGSILKEIILSLSVT